MLKSVFEKWEELKQFAIDKNLNYTNAYFMGNSTKAKIYLSINQLKLGIYIEFTKEILAEFDVPQIKEMIIESVFANFIDPSKKYIYIENDTENEDIFLAFTSSLVDEFLNLSTYYDIFDALKRVIKEYKDYFSNPNFALSKVEEQGLCAELLELGNLIKRKGEITLLNWQGPSKNKRDFVFENIAIEVKSTMSQTNTSITISNENQLDNNYPEDLERLFLSVYVLEEVSEGINILSCANIVNNLITSATLKEYFKITLLKLKIDLKIYKPKYNYKLQSKKYYLINDYFPKITKNTLNSSIYNVSYRVKMDCLDNFQVLEDDIYEQI